VDQIAIGLQGMMHTVALLKKKKANETLSKRRRAKRHVYVREYPLAYRINRI
jgi:hypothetical protein